MIVSIEPSKVAGSVQVPSSKSMGHRALICAGLANGMSTVSGITWSLDMEATIGCLKGLGATIERVDDQEENGLDERSFCITGCDPSKTGKGIVLDAYESGSTLRFMIPIAASGNEKVTFTGRGRLMERPMSVYEDLLGLEHINDTFVVQGPLRPGSYTMAGNVSSQFISGLLFALPLTKGNSSVTITGNYESRSYVDLTIKALQDAGVVVHEEERVYRIEGNQRYRAGHFLVERDFSQAAFFAVLAALNHELTLTGLDLKSAQGDKAILKFIKKAGAYVLEEKDRITIGPDQRLGQVIDLANCPDLGPILCVLAAYIPATTTIIHAGRLRMKESDRIAAMEAELGKWGVDISSDEDSITIHGKSSYRMDEVVRMEGHNDHRIVMACTVFGLCAGSPCVIEGAQAVEKSYPGFFEDIRKIGGKVEIR